MKIRTNPIDMIINSAVFLCERLKRRASEYSVQRGDGDIMEEVRLTLNQNSLDQVEEIFMERSGKISVIEKKVNA